MGRFVLHCKNATYTFEFFAANGDLILRGHNYDLKSSAQSAINLIRKVANYGHSYSKKENASGQYYYELLNEQGLVLAISELFWSEESRDYSMIITRREANAADLKDNCI